MGSTGTRRMCTERRAAVLLCVGLLAAVGCSRSGADRVAEGAGRAVVPATTSPARPPVTTGTPEAPGSPGAPTTQAPDGDAFFDPPTPLPGDAPGAVVRDRPADPAEAIPGAARELLVMYRTTGVDGTPVAATGTVSLPSGPAPAGGWPVMAWDHGTVGIGTTCAPSRSGPGAQAQGAGDMLAEFVKRGIAVVQPDYVGMGATGVRHPYLNGKSAAYATIDLVRAARRLDPGVGKTWFVAGHSQGGHAALWSSHHAVEYGSDLDLKGAVAIAPGNGFHLMPGLVAQRDATAEPYLGIFLLLVDGAAATDPALRPGRILTPAGVTAAEKAWEVCLEAVVGGGTLPSAAEVVAADADLAPITALLTASAPEQVRLTTPVFMPQGGQDPLAALNAPLAQKLCGDGGSVVFKLYPELGHTPEEVAAAGPDVVAWVQARLDGTPVEGACTF